MGKTDIRHKTYTTNLGGIIKRLASTKKIEHVFFNVKLYKLFYSPGHEG